MQLALLAFPFLAFVYGSDGDLAVGLLHEETALFGLPFTSDSRIALVSRPGQYWLIPAVQPITSANVSICLQICEPAVQIQPLADIYQPRRAFHLFPR